MEHETYLYRNGHFHRISRPLFVKALVHFAEGALAKGSANTKKRDL